MDRHLALTGLPRGGTTLACRLLGGRPDAVSLFEPMDVQALPRERAAAIERVLAFFAASRSSLAADGRAPSKLVDGEVPDNSIGTRDAAGLRRQLAAPGMMRLATPPSPGFLLTVKHNAAFSALLPELAGVVPVLAVVRNPLAVLCSWQTVPLPVHSGRLPAAERLDPGLERELGAREDPLARQLLILEWFLSRFATLPGERVLRYEDIVATGGQRLLERAGLAHEGVSMTNRNGSSTYRDLDIPRLLQGVLSIREAWEPWYAVDEVTTIAARLEGMSR